MRLKDKREYKKHQVLKMIRFTANKIKLLYELKNSMRYLTLFRKTLINNYTKLFPEIAHCYFQYEKTYRF